MAMGKTNCLAGGGNADGEVTLPASLSAISATTGDKKITLNLTYKSTSYVTGVAVRYKTGSYPTSVTDGSGMTVSGAATSIDVTGLTNGTTYYFRVFLYREVDGIRYYQTSTINAQVSGMPFNFGVSGITPLVKTDTYIVVNQSGNFTLTIPSGHTATVYLVGGGEDGEDGDDGVDTSDESEYGNGGDGGHGGYYSTASLSAGTYSCTSSIGSRYAYNNKAGTHTTLKAGSTTFTTDNGTKSTRKNGGRGGNGSGSDPVAGTDGLVTPYGTIGSSGGGGSEGGHYVEYGAAGGTGAGKGGNGAAHFDEKQSTGGSSATMPGGGGGGGGGGSAYQDQISGSSGGSGKSGCIIYELK